MKDGIYFNPRCNTCRVSLQLLKEHDVELPVIEYLDSPPDEKTLGEICRQLGVPPYELVRRKEALFDELELGSVKPDDDKRWLKVLAENPKLLQRPIVIHKGKVVIGRPPEKILDIL